MKKKGQRNQQFVLADQKDVNIQQPTVLVLHKHTILRNCRLEVNLIYLCVSEKKALEKCKIKERVNRQMQDGDGALHFLNIFGDDFKTCCLQFNFSFHFTFVQTLAS